MLEKARALVPLGDSAALAMGDELCALADLLDVGPMEVERFRQLMADKLGVKRDVLRQRHWIAQRFDPDHDVRQLGLRFSAIRLLGRFADKEAVQWANEASENGWSVRELKQQLPLNPESRRQRHCAHCQAGALPDSCVRVTVPPAREVSCCGVPCAVSWLEQRRAQGDHGTGE